MPLWLRLIGFTLAIVLLVVLTSVYVHRRASAVLGLERRGRIALGVALGAAAVALVLARAIESLIPGYVAFALGAVGSTVILGVWISTVLLWAVDGPAWIAGRVLSLRRSDPATRSNEMDLAKTQRRKGGKRASESVSGSVAVSVSDSISVSDSVSASASDSDSVSDASPPPDPLPRAGGGADPGSELEEVPPPSLLSTLGRRSMLRRSATGAALSVGFGSAFYGALFGRHDYDLREVAIPIPGLAPALDGYRIAQLSDIHFGVYVGEPELRSALALVERARPDLVVLTGDLVDHDAAYVPDLGRLVRDLGELRIRDGVVVIPGNHDYYTGVEAVLGASRRAGARILRNAGRLIGDEGGAFGLVGVDDVWATRNGYEGGPDLDRALAMVPADVPKVLLCHNPVFFPEAAGRVALQLSGHTHGGQVNLGLRPAELLLPYVEGVYEDAGSRLYVNRGFGTAGPPARVGAAPEVTVVVLTAA